MPLDVLDACDEGGSSSCSEEHRPDQVAALHELADWAGEAGLALLHEVRPFGDAERDVDRLLDEEHGAALSAELVADLDELLHHDRREAERQLVDEEQLRVADKSPPERHHLLLAARQ